VVGPASMSLASSECECPVVGAFPADPDSWHSFLGVQLSFVVQHVSHLFLPPQPQHMYNAATNTFVCCADSQPVRGSSSLLDLASRFAAGPGSVAVRAFASTKPGLHLGLTVGVAAAASASHSAFFTDARGVSAIHLRPTLACGSASVSPARTYAAFSLVLWCVACALTHSLACRRVGGAGDVKAFHARSIDLVFRAISSYVEELKLIYSSLQKVKTKDLSALRLPFKSKV
jgi:hypothetical protein